MSSALRPRLSVCMIVKNEEKRLPTCLESIRPLAAELVIVDTGSSDATAAIASAEGATVVPFEWTGDFSQARNIGLGKASGDWILVLDADEWLPAPSVTAIRDICARPPQEAFGLRQRSATPTGTDIVVLIVRLVPNRPDIRFTNPVHEELVTSVELAGIPIRETAIVIGHAGYSSSEVTAAKKARNESILDRALREENVADPQMIYHFAISLLDRGDFPRAITEFNRCSLLAGDLRPNLRATARLKMAECLVRSNLFSEAQGLLPNEPRAEHHPLALALGAFMEEKANHKNEARSWHEAVLAAADIAHMPPVSTGLLKFKSLMFLGDFWANAGRDDVGAAILRMALEINQKTCADLGPDILERYATIVEGARPRTPG